MATYYVDPARPDDSGDGLSWATAEKNVNAAIADCTSDGDIVILKNVTNHQMSDNGTATVSLTIRNENDDTDYSSCGIDTGDYFLVRCGTAGKTITAKGFSILNSAQTSASVACFGNTAGNAVNFALTSILFDGVTHTDLTQGGCFYFRDNAVVSLTDCIIQNCLGPVEVGSVGYIENTTFTLTNLTMLNNGDAATGKYGHITCIVNDDLTHTGTISGGLFDGVATVSVDTLSGDGGAFYFYTTANQDFVITISDAVFQNNVTSKGGAFHSGGDSVVKCYRTKFLSNSSYSQGGGAFVKATSVNTNNDIYVYAESCLFYNNTSTGQGGAIKIGGKRYVRLYNCTFVDNVGQDSAFIGQTLHAQDHDYVNGTANISVLTNCIVRGTLEAGHEHVTGGGNDGWDSITYCNIEEGESGISDSGATISNIQSGDPLFMNLSGEDFHLLAGSPCIDSGIDTPYSGAVTDLDGVTITDGSGNALGAGIDIGCYTFSGHGANGKHNLGVSLGLGL